MRSTCHAPLLALLAELYNAKRGLQCSLERGSVGVEIDKAIELGCWEGAVGVVNGLQGEMDNGTCSGDGRLQHQLGTPQDGQLSHQ
jgi:hypothetical protein